MEAALNFTDEARGRIQEVRVKAALSVLDVARSAWSLADRTVELSDEFAAAYTVEAHGPTVLRHLTIMSRKAGDEPRMADVAPIMREFGFHKRPLEYCMLLHTTPSGSAVINVFGHLEDTIGECQGAA